MNVLKLIQQQAYYEASIVGSHDVVRVPMSVRDYHALDVKDAIDIDTLFRLRYPYGLRHLPLAQISDVGAGLTDKRWVRKWITPFFDQRGAITSGLFDSHFEGNSSVTRSVTLFSSSGADDCGFSAGATDRIGAPTPTTVDSITFNGVGFTLATATVGPSTQQIRTGYLVAPASGAHNIVLTANNANAILGLTWIGYTGVDQTTPIDVATIAGVSATGNSVASWVLSGVASGNIALGFCAHLAAGITITPQGNTQIRNQELAATGNWGSIVVGDDVDATIAWNTNGNPPSFGQAFEVNAVAAAPPSVAVTTELTRAGGNRRRTWYAVP